MNKAITFFIALFSGVTLFAAGPGGGGTPPGGGGNQPGGGGGATFTFDTFLATTSTNSTKCLIREGVWTGWASGITAATLDSSVSTLAAGVCSGCTTLTAPGVTSVGEGAFAGCKILTAATIAAGTTLPDALFAGCTALNVGDWSGVAAFGQAALAEIPATTLTLSSSATLGAYALAADEATVVTTLSDSSVPTYDATAFLGREVSYTPEAGSIARLEAMALVTWLQEQAADSSSTIAQPTSYNTADLETWLDTASNLSAVYAFCWAERYAADANFKPLAVEGTSFLLTAPDGGTTDSVSVSVVGTNDLADEAGFTADALAKAGTTDGVTTYVSSDVSATSCFARLRFAKGW